MNNKIIEINSLFFLIFIGLSHNYVFPQIPIPTATCDGSQLKDDYAGWIYIQKGESRTVTVNGVKYNCVGCGSCTPLDNQQSNSQGSYNYSEYNTSLQMQINMFQSIVQPLFDALGQSIYNSLMGTQNNNQQAYQQQLINEQKKQQEMEYTKALQSWQNQLNDAVQQAIKEEQMKKERGDKLLTQIRIGTFGSYTVEPSIIKETQLDPLDLNSPIETKTPCISQVNNEDAIKQLLRAAYFSKMAETFMQNGDLEAARFYAGIAFDINASGSPIIIEYNPPQEILEALDTQQIAELNSQYKKFNDYFNIVLPKFERLNDIFRQLNIINLKKQELNKKINELSEKINNLEIKLNNSINQQEKQEINSLLSDTQIEKQKTENEYQEVIKTEQLLNQERQKIENELNEIKKQIENQ